VGTVLSSQQRGRHERTQRWDRLERADLCERDGDLHAQGFSQRQAAQELEVPRTTLQAWRAYQERLDACPSVVEFFHRVPGLAFRHRLVLAIHLVWTEVGACGMRLVCLFWTLTGLNRCVGASYGTHQPVTRRVAEAIVASRQEERTRLAHEMPPNDITLTQDDTCTGGLCLVGIEPVSHAMLLEHAAQARDHDTWKALREQALAGLTGKGIHSTSEEAPGLLASVEHHLGAHHSPDIFPGQPALRKAVSAPLASTQRAAAKAAAKAEEPGKRVHEPLAHASDAPAQRGPGRPPKGAASLEQVAQDVEAARQEPQRLTGQREPVTQSMRAIGHAYHCVDLDRGVRRNDTLMAGDLHAPIDTMRTIAPQAGLSQGCLHRLETAERVVPTMQATMAFVSRDVRQQGRQLDVTPPQSYARPAHLMPSYSLERVAARRTRTAGEPLRERAERLRTPRCEAGGALGELSPVEHNALQVAAAKLAEMFQRSSAHVAGRNGSLSLRNHQLRGLDHPRKRACLTAVPNFFLTRPDGTTAAERFFGQQPRGMFAAILASVELPPAPLSPPRRAVG